MKTEKQSVPLHLYLGCEVFVQKKQGKENLVKGTIVEVTRGSNHGDWVMVEFLHVMEFMYHGFQQRSSNFHTFFIEEDFIKLSLRRLESMTEEEGFECFGSAWAGDSPNVGEVFEQMKECNDFTMLHLQPDDFLYLLSKSFDLFGLIDSGAAIEKDKL